MEKHRPAKHEDFGEFWQYEQTKNMNEPYRVPGGWLTKSSVFIPFPEKYVPVGKGE